MATKTKPKSRTAKSSTKKGGFKFRWWMAAILVLIVAVVGIAILRISRASGPTATYNASQIQNLPNYHSTNVTTGNFKGSNTIRLTQAGSAISFRVQLYPGNYVICTYASTPPQGSGIMYVTVDNGPGRSAKNLTSGFTPTNGSICVAFDMLNNPSYTTEFQIWKTTNTGYADITAISIEAR